MLSHLMPLMYQFKFQKNGCHSQEALSTGQSSMHKQSECTIPFTQGYSMLADVDRANDVTRGLDQVGWIT